jgi:hypothetical protein
MMSRALEAIMGQKLERQTLRFADLQAHPEAITEMLSSHEGIPIFLEKRGETVTVGAARVYSADVDQLLQEALAEYADMKRQGYGREDGFEELEALRGEMAARSDA